jgi:hypothetical protein
MQMELQCSDLQERYRTRLLYAITEAEQAIAAAELADATRLSQEWTELCAAAEAVDVQLDGVKRKFSQTTRQQVGCWNCAGCAWVALAYVLARAWVCLSTLRNSGPCAFEQVAITMSSRTWP